MLVFLTMQLKFQHFRVKKNEREKKEGFVIKKTNINQGFQ